MFFNGYRHNPLTLDYQTYADHRPLLPQDSSLYLPGLRKIHDDNSLVYYKFNKNGKEKFILANNFKTEDRLRLDKFNRYDVVVQKNIAVPAAIATLAFTATFGEFFRHTPKIPNWLNSIGLFFLFKYGFNKFVEDYRNNIYTYYFQKYNHLAKENIYDIEDPRRKFFTPDTSSYYRETSQEIYDRKTPEQKHDPAIYYGPHPYNDYENYEELVEINKKFILGHSKFDDPEYDKILGDKIDIKRNIKDIPKFEDHKEK